MTFSPIRFRGFQDYLVRNNEEPPDVARVKKKYTFKPDSFTNVEQCYQGYKVTFPDHSSAYVHPFLDNLPHRIGARKLSKLLNFDLTKKVKVVELPELLRRDRNGVASKFGTIVDWIQGKTFKQFSGGSSEYRKKFGWQNLQEMYLFALISQDSDFHNKNIMVTLPKDTDDKKVVTLFSIDNEKSGDETVDALAGLLKKYPKELRAKVEGKNLAPEIKEKLQKFVDGKEAGKTKLWSYYPDETIERSYAIAQRLLDLGKIPIEEQLPEILGAQNGTT